MTRKIVFLDSEKIVCKYFDNGYCRFGNECKFWHSEENCIEIKCGNIGCIIRHPKPCSYYKRKKCKFAEHCKFKHDSIESDESEKMKIKLKDLEEANEKLRKELEMKDFVINAKNNTIEENEKQMKAIKAENVAMKEELVDFNKVAFTCNVCSKNHKTELELRNHKVDEHGETNLDKNLPTKQIRLSCKTCFMYVKDENDLLFHMVNEHKQKLNFKKRNKPVEVENDGNKTDDSESESDNTNETYKCKDCNFEGKNASGLKTHMKGDHKIKCNKCDFKTTTKPLLKMHSTKTHD
jgi:hypothetical protein